MVWLPVAGENGNALYLDIHSAELRHRAGEALFAVTGTLGDGLFEGLVLVEVSEEKTEVTFADAWLSAAELRAFFQRTDRAAVEAGLAEAAAAMVFCVDNFPSLAGRPRREVVGLSVDGRPVALPEADTDQLELPMGVSEEAVAWRVAG